MSVREGRQVTAGARQRTRLDEPLVASAAEKDTSSLPLPQTRAATRTSSSPQRPRSSPSTRLVTAQVQPVDPRPPPARDQPGTITEDAAQSVSAPLPREVRRKPSTTMPGSLFPRSASLDPEATPAVHDDRIYPQLSQVDSYKSSSMKNQRLRNLPDLSSRSPNPFVSNKSVPARRVISTTEDAKRFLEEFNSSPPSSPTPAIPIAPRVGAPRRRSNTTGSETVSPSAKGKARAQDTGLELDLAETTRELRVRGKEQELRDAREEHVRKEQERELDPETSMIFEERQRDKQRIQSLEEEVAWLKRQVCL